eukprot:6595232-Alexandrium_andersonii.AAC.1
MSASLVGSEMCIRDSQGSQTLSGLLGFSGTLETLEARRLSVEVSVAVSYTHLTLPTICSV